MNILAIILLTSELECIQDVIVCVSWTIDALDTIRPYSVFVFFSFNKIQICLIRGGSVDKIISFINIRSALLRCLFSGGIFFEENYCLRCFCFLKKIKIKNQPLFRVFLKTIHQFAGYNHSYHLTDNEDDDDCYHYFL